MRHFVTKRRILGLTVGLLIAGLGWGLPLLAGAAEDGPVAVERRLPVATIVAVASERFETARSYTGRVYARRVADRTRADHGRVPGASRSAEGA